MGIVIETKKEKQKQTNTKKPVCLSVFLPGPAKGLLERMRGGVPASGS